MTHHADDPLMLCKAHILNTAYKCTTLKNHLVLSIKKLKPLNNLLTAVKKLNLAHVRLWHHQSCHRAGIAVFLGLKVVCHYPIPSCSIPLEAGQINSSSAISHLLELSKRWELIVRRLTQLTGPL